jgi:hypothetical protein
MSLFFSCINGIPRTAAAATATGPAPTGIELLRKMELFLAKTLNGSKRRSLQSANSFLAVFTPAQQSPGVTTH